MFITLVVASADPILPDLKFRLPAYYLIIQGSLADVGKSMAKHPRRIPSIFHDSGRGHFKLLLAR